MYGAFDLGTAEQMEPKFDYEAFTCIEEDKEMVYNRLNRFRKLAVEMQKMYLPEGVSAKDPKASPMYSGQLNRFPPSLIIEAEYDYYRFCNEAFAKKLDEAGVPAEIPTANKTGELDAVDNDAAIVWSPSGTYVLCIMSTDAGNRIPEIIKLSGMVYEAMGE